MTAPRDQVPDRDYTPPRHSVIELSTILVITTSLVIFILAILAVLFELDEWIPAIRVSGLVFALVTSVWLVVSIWIVEFRHRRGSK